MRLVHFTTTAYPNSDPRGNGCYPYVYARCEFIIPSDYNSRTNRDVGAQTCDATGIFLPRPRVALATGNGACRKNRIAKLYGVWQ